MGQASIRLDIGGTILHMQLHISIDHRIRHYRYALCWYEFLYLDLETKIRLAVKTSQISNSLPLIQSQYFWSAHVCTCSKIYHFPFWLCSTPPVSVSSLSFLKKFLSMVQTNPLSNTYHFHRSRRFERMSWCFQMTKIVKDSKRSILSYKTFYYWQPFFVMSLLFIWSKLWVKCFLKKVVVNFVPFSTVIFATG